MQKWWSAINDRLGSARGKWEKELFCSLSAKWSFPERRTQLPTEQEEQEFQTRLSNLDLPADDRDGLQEVYEYLVAQHSNVKMHICALGLQVYSRARIGFGLGNVKRPKGLKVHMFCVMMLLGVTERGWSRTQELKILITPRMAGVRTCCRCRRRFSSFSSFSRLLLRVSVACASSWTYLFA